MREIELKILLDEAAERRIRRNPALARLAAGPAETRKLVSVYYDTPDRALAKAGMALRLRRVGRAWLQTLKKADRDMAGGLSTPHEDEAPAPGGRLDLGLVSDAGLRAAVAAAVGAETLSPVFETRFRRRKQRLALPEGEVELALDAGEIAAGGRVRAFREAELELKAGAPAAVFTAARALIRTGPVRLSDRTKAARGYALAAGKEPFPAPVPRKARFPQGPEAGAESAARVLLAECGDQIAANMATVAASDDPEGPHQLRIGLRRLRAALTALRPVIGARKGLGAEARRLGAAVGRLRDLDVLRRELLAPMGSGEDFIALDRALAAQTEDVRAALRAELAGPGPTAFLFEFGELGVATFPDARGGDARDVFARALDRRWKRVSRLGKAIATLDVASRHELRKELKILRYTAEFAIKFFKKDDSRRFLKLLRRLLDAFGAMNDAATAEALLAGPDAPARDDPLAQRAAGRLLGWYGSRAAASDWPAARTGWQRLAATGPFWRPG